MLDDLVGEERLVWLEDLGVGYCRAPAIDYGRDYFAEYERRRGLSTSAPLMAARVNLVARHHAGWMVDVGCGAGAFIEARNAARDAGENIGQTFGCDVNPWTIHWLVERGLYRDPMRSRVPAISMWDVLEHIEDPRSLLCQVDEWLFVSIPIFDSRDHALGSKHYKRGEHIWMFSAKGLIRTLDYVGFDLVEQNRMEEEYGREGIGTFVFKRK